MSAPLYYTKKGLAKVCGVTVRSIEHHARAGTLRLDKAKERIPGLVARLGGALHCSHADQTRARDPEGGTRCRTVTIQLTEPDAERLLVALQALTAALLAAGRNPGE